MSALRVMLSSALLSLSLCAVVQAQEARQETNQAQSLEALLLQVEQGLVEETQQHRQREARFLNQRNQREQMLRTAKNELALEEARSVRLEEEFEINRLKIAEKQAQLREALGSLTELFGHLQVAASDLRSNFETSPVSAQYPGRLMFLDKWVSKLDAGDRLPSIEEMERLWFEIQREMTQAGRMDWFDAMVTAPDGTKAERRVARVGVFNVVDEDGHYLTLTPGREALDELPRQPSGAFVGWAEELFDGPVDDGDFRAFAVDPTGPSGGSLLASLIDAPTLAERWHQGGVIGYLISALGCLALLLALWRSIYLTGVQRKVQHQLQSRQSMGDNPLGRLLQVYEQLRTQDVEVLELKLAEAILRERAPLESGHGFLKIIAAVAPLMGLLGTVTGMILTFQGIVIFGAGDPKAMAGGISQALVTTVLGLVVAIPTVLLHTLVTSRSRHLLFLLEERATGIVAQRAEAAQQSEPVA